jgi:transposase
LPTADWIRELATKNGAWANIPPKINRSDPICFSPYLYLARNQVERFFNRIKQCRLSIDDRLGDEAQRLREVQAYAAALSDRSYFGERGRLRPQHTLMSGCPHPDCSRQIS